MMAPVLGIILVLLCLPQYAFAASFEDFVNNLSTDLAPLIALFGEQVCLFEISVLDCVNGMQRLKCCQ